MRKAPDIFCFIYDLLKAGYDAKAGGVVLHLMNGIFRGFAFYLLSPATLGTQATLVPLAFLTEGLTQDRTLGSSISKVNQAITFFTTNNIDQGNIPASYKNAKNYRACVWYLNVISNACLTTAYFFQGAEMGTYEKHQDEAKSADMIAWIGSLAACVIYLTSKSAENYLSELINECDNKIQFRQGQQI
jgi:hypothetical protein